MTDQGRDAAGSPTVSVVVPTYKRPTKLKRALRSVRAQTYDDLEVVVVNGDPTTDVADQIPEEVDAIPVNQDEDRGVAANRNDGLERASGEFVAFLDDDDEWKPEKIERQVRRFEALDDRYGLVYTGTERVYDDHRESYLPGASGDVYAALLRRDCIPSETPLVRSSCFETVGTFDESMAFAEDWDMWLRIANAYLVDVVREPLAVCYKDHGERLSDRPKAIVDGHVGIARKFWRSFLRHPLAGTIHLLRMAKWGGKSLLRSR